jgi:hypothetical protein
MSSYTAAAVVLAADAVAGATAASGLFARHEPLPAIVTIDDDLTRER